MNNIGKSMLPVAPIAAITSAPNAAESGVPVGGDSFDSMLQQRSDEATGGQSVSPEEHADADAQAIAVDAAAQAGLIGMLFASPAIPPPPTVSTEPNFTNPIADSDTIEGTTISPEAPASPFPRTGDGGTRSPAPLESRQSSSPAKPAVVSDLVRRLSDPLPQPVRDLGAPQRNEKSLPPKDAPLTLDVANVLGIIPPVQATPTASIDAAVRSTPHPGIKPAVAIVATITPAIPFTDAPTFSAPDNEPAIVAQSAPDVAPATFATPTAQPVLAQIEVHASPTADTLSRPATSREPESILSDFTPEIFTGTTAAKPGHAMPAPTLQRQQRPAPVTSAGAVSNDAAPVASANDGAQTLRPSPVSAAQNGREHSAGDHSENTERPQTPDIATAGFPRDAVTTFASHDATAPIRSADVAQVVTQTIHAAEQLRTTGQERVEVAVKLEGGHDLIIQLRVANGEVTPVIRTDSEPLRLALEQNWPLFSQRGGDRDLRVTTPVFESPQTSSNMSDLNQQRDQRQRAFNEPAHEFSQPQSPRRNAPLSSGTTPAPTTGVRLYA